MKSFASLFFLLLAAFPLAAQDTPAPFSKIAIGGGIAANSNENRLHRYWQSRQAGEVLVQMPFYWGDIQAGWRWQGFRGRSEDFPDYLTWYHYLQFGKSVSLPLRFLLSAAVRTGNARMQFEENDIYPGEGTVAESELLAGANLMLHFKPHDRISWYGGVEYMAIFTRQRIELTFWSTGIMLHFDTPDWLQDFLE